MTRHRGCICCGRGNALFGPVRMFNGLPQIQTVCDLCLRHQGSHERDLRLALRIHAEMAREDLREAIEVRDNRLTQTIAAHLEREAALAEELRLEREQRPIQVVHENLDIERVNEALDDRERAYRSRDRAFRSLAMLHMRHFETASARCRCGKRWDDCEDAQIIDTSKALRAWERAHAQRRKEGRFHQLPPDHPGVVDARWDPDDGSMVEAYDEYYEQGDSNTWR